MTRPFYVKFWGVRGTMPAANQHMMRYGGNTSCVEVRCGPVVIALDAGTGIIQMGEQDFTHMHLLLSHTHLDHIIGLCAMKKMFSKHFSADVWAGHLMPDMLVHEALGQLISPPLFPIPLNKIGAKLTFHDFSAGMELTHQDFEKEGITIHTVSLHHPDRATGYRINYQGHSICYITDIEHLEGGLDETIIQFCRNSDVFIYDSTYDDRQFSSYKGWGHSTWQQAVRLGEEAQVGAVVLFHHDMSATDNILDLRLKELTSLYTQPAIIAREGLVLEPAMLKIKSVNRSAGI